MNNIDILEHDGKIVNLGEKYDNKWEKRKLGQEVKTTQSRGRTRRHSMRIVRKIVETFVKSATVYQNTDLLLAYVDAKREVETRLLMERAWKDHKKVAAPRVDGDGIMDYYYINSLDDLDPGSFGIMEPKMELPSSVKRMRMD